MALNDSIRMVELVLNTGSIGGVGSSPTSAIVFFVSLSFLCVFVVVVIVVVVCCCCCQIAKY